MTEWNDIADHFDLTSFEHTDEQGQLIRGAPVDATALLKQALMKIYSDPDGQALIESIPTINKEPFGPNSRNDEGTLTKFKIQFIFQGLTTAPDGTFGPLTDHKEGQILVNPEKLTTAAGGIGFINAEGQFVKFTLDRAIYHELNHAVRGLDDGAYGGAFDASSWTKILGDAQLYSDTKGATAIKENLYAARNQPGNQFQRVNYKSAGSAENLDAGQSWTQNKKVSNVLVDLFGPAFSSTFDLSNFGGVASLVVGLNGDDTIVGDAGSDFLYGGTGNDTVYASGGNDFINGGDLKTPAAADGRDSADYSNFGGLNKDNAGSITVYLGEPSDHSDLTVQKSQGGLDSLVSIEKVIGTSSGDKIVVNSIAESVVVDLIIDLGAGYDLVEVTDPTNGYIIKLGDRSDQTAQLRIANTGLGTGPKLHFRNAEDGTGGSGNDIIYAAPDDGKTAKGGDPLVLDLDGDGIELDQLTDYSSPLFDIDGDGIREVTAWITGGDGFLARDLNSNGKLDSIAELFGRNDASGFADLATLDSNADGIIDSSDVAFSSLRVWVGSSGDVGQFLTLSGLGIASISLQTRDPSLSESSINGNDVSAIGSYTKTDGTTRKIADVSLNYLDGTADDDNNDSDNDGQDKDRDDPTSPRGNRKYTSIVDGGAGNDEVYAYGGKNKLTAGGLGRDLITNTSKGGELWGDVANSFIEVATDRRFTLKTTVNADGTTSQTKEYIESGHDNADNFVWAPGTTIMDPQRDDILTFAGLPLVGGSDEGGIGLSLTNLGLSGPLNRFIKVGRPLETVYADQILPFITYAFEKQSDGSYDLLVGNVNTAFLDATEAVFSGRSGLSAELKKHYGAQRIKDFIPAKSHGLFAYTYRGIDQQTLADKKLASKLGLVFKKANPILAILDLPAGCHA
jgi:RTX calcium-binding nonapeptide repeat (4 copies)